MMEQLLDLERYPLDDLATAPGQALVARCRRELAERGMFSLEGFVRTQALTQCVAEIRSVFDRSAFTHKRSHNIYFKDEVTGLAADHPALRRFETINHTICADQIPDSIACRIYEWPCLADFLAAAMGKPRLYPMADSLARVNVMAYREGEELNWHFDRSEFTTTLLLQSAESGGDFQYRSDLRSENNPNYDGVARLLAGEDNETCTLSLTPGTLNVFMGRNTAHRVTPVECGRERIVAVFSYFEKPAVVFGADEQLGFYGRVDSRT